MKFRLLSCDVLMREVCHCIVRSPHTVDLSFTPRGEHNEPAKLRARLQADIDAASSNGSAYDAILIGYGLCGNATQGLVARDVPLVVPRAHDCTTLFLGSRQAFQEHFGSNPSQTWASVGYAERGDTIISDSSTRDWLGMGQDYAELVAQYGEENARYLMEALRVEHGSDQLFLLDVPETRVDSILERIRAYAEAEGRTIKPIQGSIRLIDTLLSGEWPEPDFLIVPPRHRVEGIYDYEEVIRAVPAE